MKNETIRTIYDILTGTNTNETDKLAVIRELEDSFAREAEKAAAKVETYDAIHEAVFSVLSTRPQTISAIYEACKDKLPEGVGKGQVQYGITRKWASEIVKIEGKPNEYRLPV